MDNLKVIENELVPVYETDKGIKVVYGTELHETLESKTDFSTWIKRRLSECDATEKDDYTICSPNLMSKKQGGSNKIEYIIKLNTAKEMAMLERNEQGKKVRKYFISIEEKYKQAVINMSQPPQELQAFFKIGDLMTKWESEQKRQAEELENLKAAIENLNLKEEKVSAKDWRKRNFPKIKKLREMSGWRSDYSVMCEMFNRLGTVYNLEKNVKLMKKEPYELPHCTA